jgi:hypothetical protein
MAAEGVLAEDYNPPPWPRSDSGATYQIWEFGTEYVPGAFYPAILPEDSNNPAGDATVSLTGGFLENTLWYDVYPQASPHIGVWGFEYDMIASVPNLDQQNPATEVWVQMTYLADITPILWLMSDGDIGSAAVMTLVDDTPLHHGYNRATWHGIIEANPTFEEIWIRPSECTVYIAELVIDTYLSATCGQQVDFFSDTIINGLVTTDGIVDIMDLKEFAAYWLCRNR